MALRPAPLLAAAALLASPAAAQLSVPVPGTVVDLVAEPGGFLAYATAEGEVGRIAPDGNRTVVVDPGSAPFGNAPHALAPAPGGALVVLDFEGDLWRVPAVGAPEQTYDDLYLANDPTDLVVDAAGVALVAGRTISSNTRTTWWISEDGQDWAYHLVARQPIALAHDPLTGGFVVSNAEAGGQLLLLDPDPEGPSYQTLATGLASPFSVGALDGDVAVEADGDAWFASAGTVQRLDRSGGGVATIASLAGTVRGVALAAASDGSPSATGWSAYVAHGANPTTVVELADCDAPAAVVPPALGTVPDRGTLRLADFTWNVYELSTDADGHLLAGGDFWGAQPQVRRIALPGLAQTTLATDAHGLDGRVMGVEVTADGTLLVLTKPGSVFRVPSAGGGADPLFVDPGDAIASARDLALAADGTVRIAERAAYKQGAVHRVDLLTDVLETLAPVVEARGVHADPFATTFLATEWNSEAFTGTVGRVDEQAGALVDLVGFGPTNWSNGDGWGDGDLVVDAEGNVYSVAEDEFAVVRWRRSDGAYTRVGSGYLGRPSGLAIARSTPGAGSATGFSLWVQEWNRLWEIPGVPPPAPRRLDLGAPPIGALAAGLDPAFGAPRAVAADPFAGGLVVSTADATLLRVDPVSGAVSVLADASDGLAGDLVGLAVDRATGRVVAARVDGVLHELLPGTNYTPTVLFDDAGNALRVVTGVALDGLGRVLVHDRTGLSLPAGRLWRLDGGGLTSLARTGRGVSPAVDPTTGEVWVTQRGAPGESGGELLRVDGFAATPFAGHHDGAGYQPFAVADFAGGLAISAAGDAFVAVGGNGRVVRVDRAGGTTTVLAGSYDRPRGVALAPGTPGVAGAAGASLFVLEQHALYELGVDDAPPGPLPAAPVPNAEPPGLRAGGEAQFGATTPLALASPGDAGRVFVVLPGFSGKEPGFALSQLQNPFDPRVVPLNVDPLWAKVGAGALASFLGVLDGEGASPPGLGLPLPADPSFVGLDDWLDLSWVTLELVGFAPNGIATVGGTAQLFVGE